ncbi:uncharacterized protein LOC142349552 [Convolutriloba macropyga]|uniref:uncharacterized protein LOC142349552 n=1 Tax=Convolutriloba macropyga TaxID=536237 RepID=UPI003F526CFF
MICLSILIANCLINLSSQSVVDRDLSSEQFYAASNLVAPPIILKRAHRMHFGKRAPDSSSEDFEQYPSYYLEPLIPEKRSNSMHFGKRASSLWRLEAPQFNSKKEAGSSMHWGR